MFKLTALFLVALALLASPTTARPKKWSRRHVDAVAHPNEVKESDNIFTELTKDVEAEAVPKVEKDSDEDFDLGSLFDSDEDGPVTDFKKLIVEIMMEAMKKELEKTMKEEIAKEKKDEE